MSGGYVPCGCRDCFEVAIGERGALCAECKAAGCEACTCSDPEGNRATGEGRCTHGECLRPDAYGGGIAGFLIEIGGR